MRHHAKRTLILTRVAPTAVAGEVGIRKEAVGIASLDKAKMVGCVRIGKLEGE